MYWICYVFHYSNFLFNDTTKLCIWNIQNNDLKYISAMIYVHFTNIVKWFMHIQTRETTQRRSFINKRRKWKSIVKCKAWEILGNCIFRHFRRTNSFYCQTLKHRTERTKDGNRMFFIWFCKQRMNKSGNRLLEE